MSNDSSTQWFVWLFDKMDFIDPWLDDGLPSVMDHGDALSPILPEHGSYMYVKVYNMWKMLY